MRVELIEDLSAEEVAADTADDADQSVEDEIGCDHSVYRSVGDRVDVSQAEIKLNGGKIGYVIGGCARQIEDRGRSARREKSVESTAESARNDAVRDGRLDLYLFIEE